MLSWGPGSLSRAALYMVSAAVSARSYLHNSHLPVRSLQAPLSLQCTRHVCAIMLILQADCHQWLGGLQSWQQMRLKKQPSAPCNVGFRVSRVPTVIPDGERRRVLISLPLWTSISNYTVVICSQYWASPSEDQNGWSIIKKYFKKKRTVGLISPKKKRDKSRTLSHCNRYHMTWSQDPVKFGNKV